jgi:hypothetical protein
VKRSREDHESEGVFSFPGLPAGTYTVTISFPGFKTVEVETRLAGGTTNALPPVTLKSEASSKS